MGLGTSIFLVALGATVFWSSWGAGWRRRRAYVESDDAARKDRYDDIDRAA